MFAEAIQRHGVKGKGEKTYPGGGRGEGVGGCEKASRGEAQGKNNHIPSKEITIRPKKKRKWVRFFWGEKGGKGTPSIGRKGRNLLSRSQQGNY